jgi:hypothetical protein
MAIKFRIFPWKKEELREALLKCEGGHVTLVAAHTDKSTVTAQDPLQLLLAYIRNNQHKFLDLTKVANGESVADQDAQLGYRTDEKGKFEFLFTTELFEEIVGGKGPAGALKQKLDGLGLIAKTSVGKQSQKYVARRYLVSEQGKKKERQWVVAIDAKILDIDTQMTG